MLGDHVHMRLKFCPVLSPALSYAPHIPPPLSQAQTPGLHPTPMYGLDLSHPSHAWLSPQSLRALRTPVLASQATTEAGDTLVMLHVPYSNHSSHDELGDFLDWVTVGGPVGWHTRLSSLVAEGNRAKGVRGGGGAEGAQGATGAGADEGLTGQEGGSRERERGKRGRDRDPEGVREGRGAKSASVGARAVEGAVMTGTPRRDGGAGVAVGAGNAGRGVRGASAGDGEGRGSGGDRAQTVQGGREAAEGREPEGAVTAVPARGPTPVRGVKGEEGVTGVWQWAASRSGGAPMVVMEGWGADAPTVVVGEGRVVVQCTPRRLFRDGDEGR